MKTGFSWPPDINSARVGRTVGQVRYGDQLRVLHSGHSAKSQFGRLAASAPDVEHQGLLPQLQLIVNDLGADLEFRFHHRAIEIG